MRIDDTIVDIRPQWVPWDKDLCLCLNGNDWQMFQRKSENNKVLSIERNVMDYDTEYNIISTRTKKFQSYAKDKNAMARLFFDMMKIKKQKEWMFCSVPGSVQTAILENEKTPVPIYHSLNIQSLQTSTMNKESWFYKSFQVPLAWKSKILRLHFAAVDYEADFFLNGNYIGSHVGHFSPAEFEVSKYVKFRDYNEILLRIHPFPEDKSRTARSAIFKNQITDNTPAVCPLGISDDVYLIASDRLYIKDLCVRTKLNKDFSTAEIQFQLLINSAYSLKAEVEYLIRSQQNNQRIHIKKVKVIDYGRSELNECIFLTDPQLWWPNGSGPQNMYVADVIIRDSEASILEKYSAKFGIRKLEMDFNEGAKEIPFPWTFVINGKKIYFKGAGCPPSDCFYRNEESRYDHFLLLAKYANFNLLRWWGGGIPERTAFYDLCDRYGLLVFHDFFLSNDNYDNSVFLKRVLEDGPYFVKKRRNHPCLALWNGGNELNYAYTRSSQVQATVAAIIAKYDPDRPNRPSSPCYDFGEAHSITPYNYDPDMDYKRANNQEILIATEGNCSTIANLSCLKRIIPKDELENFDPTKASKSWLQHNIYSNWGYTHWNWLDHDMTEKLFGSIDSLELYIEANQYTRGQCMKYGLEEFRRQKFYKSGTSIWQYNEPWPNAAGNTLVDWYGNPRFSYYFAAKAYEHIHCSLRFDKIKWRGGEKFTSQLWATNDNFQDIQNCEIAYSIWDYKGVKVKEANKVDLLSANKSIKVFDIEWHIPDDYDSYFIVDCRIADKKTGELLSTNDYIHTAHTSTSYCLKPLLDCPLTSLCLYTKSEDSSNSFTFLIKNTGKTNALVCTFNLPVPEGITAWFSDNAFSLYPGAERIIEMNIVNTSLYAWKPNIKNLSVKAWNAEKVTPVEAK